MTMATLLALPKQQTLSWRHLGLCWEISGID